MIAAPCRNALSWGTMSIPPTSEAHDILRNFPRNSASSAVCCANSRVGARMSICGFRSPIFISCINGSKNANVFPEPVFARTIKSLFQSSESTLSCTSIGESNPCSLRADNNSFLRPYELKSKVYYSSKIFVADVLSHIIALKLFNFPAGFKIHVNKLFGSHSGFEKGVVHFRSVAYHRTGFIY